MKNKTVSTGIAAIILAIASIVASAQAQFQQSSFSVFGPPQSLGMPVNTGDNETGVCMSPNGLSLYFSSNSAGSLGGLDIWVSQRSSLTAAWGTPQNLGALLNSTGIDNLPALSADGKTLFFNSSGRGDGLGGADIYMSTRSNPNDDLGWTAAVNLGAVVNTSANEIAPTYFVDPTNGSAVLYFTSDRVSGLGGEDIYQSTRNANGTFNTPTNVTALNSASVDRRAEVRRDGLEVFFTSDRGPLVGRDTWVSTRASISAPWNPPVNVAAVNSPGDDDQHPSLSPDGSIVYFASSRDGSQDIYAAHRIGVNRSAATDFDGDARSDLSVFRPSDGTWHVLQSSTNTYTVQRFGSADDKIVAGDYDGDGRTDTAVFRPSNGTWYILRSSDGQVNVTRWGVSTDRPVPGDYDGDGQTDIAVYRNGTWYIVQSSNGISYQQFGLSSDVPIFAGVQ